MSAPAYFKANTELQHSEAISQLQAIGFKYTECISYNGSGRMPSIGKPASNRSAWYSWTADGQALHYNDHANGITGTIFASEENRVTPDESRRLTAQAKERRQQRQATQQRQQKQAAQFARNALKAASTEGAHPYIERKHLSSLHNARIDPAGRLVIPMWVYGDGLINLQRIQGDGTKRFLKGGRVKGAYSVIGCLDKAQHVLICEGWATGCTLHEKHKHPVVIAFSAGNLLPVAQVIREQFPDASIVVCGDDDRQTAGNPGRTQANSTAKAIRSLVAYPQLCKACKCTDFNDAELCSQRRANG